MILDDKFERTCDLNFETWREHFKIKKAFDLGINWIIFLVNPR